VERRAVHILRRAKKVEETTFLPRALQRPRIPIWVAGVWPSRAPMRRAARWDGAFPIRNDLSFLDVATVNEIGACVAKHRPSGEPIDLVIGRDLPADDAEARDAIAVYAAAGVTWWIESDQTPEEVRAKLRRSPLYMQ
jgi:alkanesulfonate monooxygenase SsuD/methylene tetrahydromethanopterin reductase-like flavin-dependent oxidoreductase (luciferase family)